MADGKAGWKESGHSHGDEEVDLTGPGKELEAAGAQTFIVSPPTEKVTGWDGQSSFPWICPNPAAFDALLIRAE